jgi:hypothetical protein
VLALALPVVAARPPSNLHEFDEVMDWEWQIQSKGAMGSNHKVLMFSCLKFVHKLKFLLLVPYSKYDGNYKA